MNWFRRAIGLDCAQHEVANASRLEGSGGLEVFKFEVYIAVELLVNCVDDTE